MGISAVGTAFDGLTIENNEITSIGSSAANWSAPSGLTVRGAGIVLFNSGGVFESVDIHDNNVDITSGSSFFQRAVFLKELHANITGNTLAGAANDLIFQFATGGASLIDDNDFVGVHSLGGAGVLIGDPNSNSPTTITNNRFTPAATPFTGTSLLVNRNVNGATSSILIDNNIFNGDVTGVSVGGANGVTVSNNEFTAKASTAGIQHIVVDSQDDSLNASPSTPIDTQVFGNKFHLASGASGTAIVLRNTLAGSTYAPDGVKVGVGGANIYDAGFTIGVDVSGGIATIQDNIGGATTGVRISDGTTLLAGSTLSGNTTGVLVTGTGLLTIGAGDSISGGATGLKFDGAAVGLTGLDLGDISIGGQSGDYITLANSAFDNLELDATGTTLGGTLVSSMTTPQKFAAEGKITDEIDDNTLGLVVLQASTIFVTPTSSPTATDNDYTRIVNALAAAADGDTILLGPNGLDTVFNWNEANALASWELGNDATIGTDDDWGAMLPAGLNNVTVTADILDGITIQGPGDLTVTSLETGFLAFGNGTNTGWTFSNFNIFDIDNAIGLFYDTADNYSGLTVDHMHIRMPADNTTEPDDFQNIGIYYSFGQNIHITNNTIDIVGTGDGSSVGIQSTTHGGASYDGLMITGNTINVLNPGAESVLGIWENGHGHSSNITIADNHFFGNGDPTTIDQTAFWLTSHSSGTTTVSYNDNTVDNASIGFKWLGDPEYPGSDFSAHEAIQLTGNTLTNVNTGMLVQSNGKAILSGNMLTNTGAMEGIGVGIDVAAGSIVTIDGSPNENAIVGFDTGIRSAGTLTVEDNNASIHGNAIGIDVTGGTATITGNHIYDNTTAGIRFTTGGGGSVTGNNFDDTTDNGTDLQIDSTASSVTIGAGNTFAGEKYFIDNQSTQSFDLTPENSNAQNYEGLSTANLADDFRIEDHMFHKVDDASKGLITWVKDNVYVTTPGSVTVGSSDTDSDIQRGVDAASPATRSTSRQARTRLAASR